MRTRLRTGPATGWRMVMALVLLFGQTRAVVGTPAKHRTAPVAHRRPPHRASHLRSKTGKGARQSHPVAAGRAEAVPSRPPRWHPGVDLALRLSGKCVPRR